jgi:hypothetical protein
MTMKTTQVPGKLTPLPDKLTPSVESRVGKVDFDRGLPTPKGIEQLFEIQDFQRACQLYQWAIPAVGVMGWHRANLATGARKGDVREIKEWQAIMDHLRSLPVRRKGELPVIPVDERAAEVRAIKMG